MWRTPTLQQRTFNSTKIALHYSATDDLNDSKLIILVITRFGPLCQPGHLGEQEVSTLGVLCLHV